MRAMDTTSGSSVARRTRRIGRAGVAVAAMLVLLIAGPVLAFGKDGPGKHDRDRGHGHHPDPGGELISQHAEELGLSDDAHAAIREAISSSRERGEELRFELDEAHRRLTFMLSRDEPDEDEVMKQAEVIGKIRIEESKHRLQTLLEVRSMLTSEQREKLESIRRRAPHGGAARHLARACEGDVERLCPGIERGPERLRCMGDHRDEISDDCRRALERVRHGERH
jgi:Spy/CpxP family protein refolding chaperone